MPIKESKELQFTMIGDDGEYHELSRINEIELNPEQIETSTLQDIDDIVQKIGQTQTFEASMPTLEVECGKLNPWRYLASGCDKSRYNAMTLKEDGYLSKENGWISL